MFFKKSKRIKELEKENEELRRLTNTVNKFPLTIREFNIKKIAATGEFPTWYDYEVMEDEVRHRLFSEIIPFIKIEYDFNKADDKYLIQASVRVVEE